MIGATAWARRRSARWAGRPRSVSKRACSARWTGIATTPAGGSRSARASTASTTNATTAARWDARTYAMGFEVLDSRLEGPLYLQPQVFGDERGFFTETFRADAFAALGITEPMIQHNHSRSKRGIVRGMHYQIGDGASKLVRCGRGAITDVLVDVRRG